MFGYTGEETDGTGLVQLRARYYNPTLGVFPSLDPLETANRYSYVGGNPINFRDPSGLADPGCKSSLKAILDSNGVHPEDDYVAEVLCSMQETVQSGQLRGEQTRAFLQQFEQELADNRALHIAAYGAPVAATLASMLPVLAGAALIGGSLAFLAGLYAYTQTDSYKERMRKPWNPYSNPSNDPRPDLSACNCEERAKSPILNPTKSAKYGGTYASPFLNPIQDMLCDLHCNNGDYEVALYTAILSRGVGAEVLDSPIGFNAGQFVCPGEDLRNALDMDMRGRTFSDLGGRVFVRQPGEGYTRADRLATFVEEIYHAMQRNNMTAVPCRQITVFDGEAYAKNGARNWVINSGIPQSAFTRWSELRNPAKTARSYGEFKDLYGQLFSSCPGEAKVSLVSSC